jgi:hypothetical protein
MIVPDINDLETAVNHYLFTSVAACMEVWEFN